MSLADLNDIETDIIEASISMLDKDIINCLTILSDNDFSKDKLTLYFLERLNDDLMYDFILQIQNIQNDSLKEVIYNFYLKIGRSYYRNLFKNLSCLEECIRLFRSFGVNGKRVDVSLMNEILKVQECSISEIQMYDDSFIIMILDQIEAERDDEEYNYELLNLLLNIQDQYDAKYTSIPDLALKVNRILALRINSSKTLSENIIFLTNRSIEPSLKKQLARFTRRILEDTELDGFFYTNDIKVLIDVTLREIQSLDVGHDDLIIELISLLPLLLKQCTLDYKRKTPEITKSLLEILSSNSGAKIKKCASKVLESEYLKN